MSTNTSHNSASVAIDSDELPDTPVPQTSREQLWSPLFVLVVAVALCCFMTGQGLNSGTSVFISLTGGTAFFSGILAAVFSIASGAGRFVCGPLVDQFGRLRIMVAGMALMALGTLIPALITNDALFIVCRVVQGFGFSAATTATATAAADVLPLSRLGEGLGYYGLGQALAMSVGPAFALFLVGTNPATNLYLGLAAIAIIGVVFSAFCRYERNPQRLPKTSTFRRSAEKKQRETAENTAVESHAANNDAASSGKAVPTERGWRRVLEVRALPGALPLLVLSPAFGFSIFFIGLYGTSLGIGNAGMFYTLSAVSMIAVRLKSRSFMDRVAPLKIFGAAALCGLIAFALLLTAGMSDISYYVSGLIYGACLGVSVPLSQTVAVKNTPPERWGAANALFSLAPDVGIGFSSILWGFINDTAGFSVTICCAMGCIVASFIVAWLVYPKD